MSAPPLAASTAPAFLTEEEAADRRLTMRAFLAGDLLPL